ncbi:hypothetical protein BZA70DRAFT_307859 [Myxozyma melibiosi]|uniref:Ribosomal protein S4/S9 N-terminal domain-containing protein n=1 Tax=Myxozyma melibiosi TaxID=54550 RepID=A0ABR1EY14_9ASCO
MVRTLKHHEQKLLKKVSFLEWKGDNGHREADVMRRYHVEKRDDYHKYNKLCGQIRQMAHKLAQLPPDDPVRQKHEELLLDKLENMGILGAGTTKISALEKNVTVSAFCRRRIGVVMCRLRMAETISAAVKLVEQGHVRVGPEVVTDPAYLVTRNREDYLTWVDSSKIKRTILAYRNELDDYDLL